MDISGVEEENAAEEHYQLVNESSNNLEGLVYDVWSSSILPCLDVRSIFRLCRVSRKLREQLLTEQTFKLLCVHRYGISPLLSESYIGTSKTLYVATSVGRLDLALADVTNSLPISFPLLKVVHDIPRPVLRASDEELVVCLPSLSSEMANLEMEENCFLRVSIRQVCLAHPESVVKHLPNLKIEDIEQSPPLPIPAATRSNLDGDVLLSNTMQCCSEWPHLSALSSLSLKRCGTLEVYQTHLIKKISRTVSNWVPFLPNHYRAQRLLAVVEALSCTGDILPESLECLGIKPTNLPGYEFWFAMEITKWHTALQLYIVNQLDLSLEDYITVCLRHRRYRDKHRVFTVDEWRNFYEGLGFFLSEVLHRNHSEKRVSREELFEYFVQHCHEGGHSCLNQAKDGFPEERDFARQLLGLDRQIGVRTKFDKMLTPLVD
ncbi:uncharacterized protein LOC135825864 [Sycon ciliatum]|uniref:uncharacterized protein LOC135825864 n=1 Tax=Sycon ciliatum TaxID=27933 RepID=UPI0031F6904E